MKQALELEFPQISGFVRIYKLVIYIYLSYVLGLPFFFKTVSNLKFILMTPLCVELAFNWNIGKYIAINYKFLLLVV